MRGIEGYRVRNGVKDRDNALGREPKDRAALVRAAAGQRAAAARTARAGIEKAAVGRAYDAPRDRAMTQQVEDQQGIGGLTEPLLKPMKQRSCSMCPGLPSTSWSGQDTCRIYELVARCAFTREHLVLWLNENTFR